MKKLAIVLTSLTVVASAIIFIAIFTIGGGPAGISMHNVTSTSAIAPNDTQSMKDEALRIALTDPDVQAAINGTQGKYDVEAIDIVDPKDVGYLNLNGTFVRVSIQASPIIERIHYHVVVDVANHREMGISYGGSPIVMMRLNDWAIVPPGASWYHHIIIGINGTAGGSYVPGGTEVLDVDASVDYLPADAIIYPLILDNENFDKMQAGDEYDIPQLLDPSTGKSVQIGGNKPIRSGWNVHLMSPPRQLPRTFEEVSKSERSYYLILKNPGSGGDVRVTFKEW
jgi:hypothetical protein